MLNYIALKKHRIEAGISQSKLAELMNKSQQVVSKWEKGLSSPSIDDIELLAGYIDIDLEELLLDQVKMLKLANQFDAELLNEVENIKQEFYKRISTSIDVYIDKVVNDTIERVGESAGDELEFILDKHKDSLIAELSSIESI